MRTRTSAFLPKVAFPAFAIDDCRLPRGQHAADKSLPRHSPTAPARTSSTTGARATGSTFDGEPDDYWGDQGPHAEPRVPLERRGRRSGSLELQSGTVDGIDNPGTDDFATIKADSDAQVLPARRRSTRFYLGFNNTVEAVDEREGPPGDRHGHRPPADRRQLLPRPARRSPTHFTPVRDPVRLRGRRRRGTSTSTRPSRCSPRAWPKTASTASRPSSRSARRSAATSRTRPQIAQEIAAQLKTNLGINADARPPGVGHVPRQHRRRHARRASSCSAGARTSRTPRNFLDYHFGSGSGKKFGEPFPDIVGRAPDGRPVAADDATRKAAYTEANNLIKQHVPAVIVAHGGSGTAFKADVEGAHTSPLGNEVFSVMKAADRDTLVFDAERRAAQPVLRRRDGRRDAPRLRADQRVAVRLQGRRHGHRAGARRPRARRTPTCTVWTCTLRDGVKFHDGADLRRQRRRASATPPSGTPQHPLHIGRTGAFEYWPGLWGGFLNPPAPLIQLARHPT